MLIVWSYFLNPVVLLEKDGGVWESDHQVRKALKKTNQVCGNNDKLALEYLLHIYDQGDGEYDEAEEAGEETDIYGWRNMVQSGPREIRSDLLAKNMM